MVRGSVTLKPPAPTPAAVAGHQELVTRGGRRFRPAYLLAALVAFVFAVAITSTWYRREFTVGEGTTAATLYGLLALALWLGTLVLAALAFVGRAGGDGARE